MTTKKAIITFMPKGVYTGKNGQTVHRTNSWWQVLYTVNDYTQNYFTEAEAMEVANYYKENIVNVTPEVQRLANATKTHCCCGGHKKAMVNEMLAEKYREDMIAKGQPIPPKHFLLAIGNFNGEGAE
jgi:hypothetical protein